MDSVPRAPRPRPRREARAFSEPPGTPLNEPARLMTELWMPFERVSDVVNDQPLPGSRFGPQWREWWFQFFGIALPRVDPEKKSGELSDGLPVLKEENMAGGPDRWIQVWLIRAWPAGSPLAVERRWHPEWGHRDLLVGLERPHNRADVEEARGGFELLSRLVNRGGRPQGRTKYPTLESFEKAVRALYQRSDDQRWKLDEAKDSRIAKWLKISKTTLYERLKDYGYTLADIQQQRI